MQLYQFAFAALAGSVAFAQQPAAPKLYASAADVAAMAAKSKADRKDQPNIISGILSLAPYNASLEYRASVGNASSHAKEAEMFYVVDGGGTLVTGGKIVNETHPNPDNSSGSAIEGGQTRKVGKGDFIMVPEGTPHWFSAIDGVLVLMSIHLPHPVK